MIYLHFLLDICFYNFTPFKTNLCLLPLLEKRDFKFFFIWILMIDFLLSFHLRYFFIFLVLHFFNRFIKLPHSFYYLVLRFCLLFVLYHLFVFVLFQKLEFNIWGFFIDLLFLRIECLKSNSSSYHY